MNPRPLARAALALPLCYNCCFTSQVSKFKEEGKVFLLVRFIRQKQKKNFEAETLIFSDRQRISETVSKDLNLFFSFASK